MIQMSTRSFVHEQDDKEDRLMAGISEKALEDEEGQEMDDKDETIEMLKHALYVCFTKKLCLFAVFGIQWLQDVPIEPKNQEGFQSVCTKSVHM